MTQWSMYARRVLVYALTTLGGLRAGWSALTYLFLPATSRTPFSVRRVAGFIEGLRATLNPLRFACGAAISTFDWQPRLA
jgi:hypothetical protein